MGMNRNQDSYSFFVVFHFSSFLAHNLFTVSPDLLMVFVYQSTGSEADLTASILHKTLTVMD